MQTQIIYNGITIRDVLTDSINVEPVKDSTGVDQLGIHVTVQCTGVVHMAASNHTGVQVGSFGSDIDGILMRLSKDRRPFKMQIGSSVIYDVKPGAVEPGISPQNATQKLDQMDIDNGPKPHVEIRKITAGYAATIAFRVEFVIPNCGDPITRVPNASGLVNFRFWIHEDVDCRTWLTTRMYVGRLRVAHKNVSPHALARVVVVPPLQPGFKREVIGLHESENGLDLDFTIIDREMIVAAPWSPITRTGATEWRGTFSTSTSDFATSFSELQFHLTGPKGTPKRDLLLIGLNIVSAKTHYLSLQKNVAGQAFLDTFAIKEELAENSVEFVCRLRHTGTREQMIGLFGIGGQLEVGQPLGNLGIGFDDQIAFQPGTSATLTGLFRSILQTPCSPARMPQAQDKPPARYEAVIGSGTQNPRQRDSLPGQQGPASKSHLDGVYLDYRMESILRLNTGNIGLANGAAKNSTAPTLSIVNLHRPTSIREIRGEASRVGKPPEMPTPGVTFSDSNGIVHTPIGKPVILAAVPQLSADNRKLLYGASFELWYAMSRPPRFGEKVAVGALPYWTVSQNDPSRSLPPETFVSPNKMLS